MQSLTIFVVVKNTITEKITVQIGSTTDNCGQIQIIAAANITPQLYTISPKI